jgi:hypothetical protein
MARSIVEFREALTKLQAIHEEGWTKDNFSVELTRALTTIENARLEFNSARLKFPVLAGSGGSASGAPGAPPPAALPLGERRFAELCKLGLALTWPLAVVVLLALGALMVVLLRH